MNAVGRAYELVLQVVERTGKFHKEHNARNAGCDKHKSPVVPRVFNVLHPLLEHLPHLQPDEHTESDHKEHTVD